MQIFSHNQFTKCYSVVLATCVLAVTGVAACSPDPSAPDADRQALADEMNRVLQEQLLAVWYPRVVDREHGGFLSRFDYRWVPQEPQDKFIVTQARHMWTTARAARFYPKDTLYLPIAAHGFAFLREVMWDEVHGGFFRMVTRDGTVKTNASGAIVKQAYGQAFAIYALAAYYAASGNAEALRLAQEAFHWLDTHAHDPMHGGYFQFMARDGTPFKQGYDQTPPKDQNSSIHLLEAFTALYRVWPDRLVRVRLREMLRIVRDTLVTDRGYLTLFARADWTPVSYRDSAEAVRAEHYHLDHVSFGHDVETAFLLLEASETLGLEHDTTTLRIAKKMVDHALRNGWDEEEGGLYDAGYYYRPDTTIVILEDTKNWWAQAEALNSLLLMADLFPDNEMRYYNRFLQQWAYIKAHLIDWEHGGWYAGGLDKQPEMRTALKSHIWKGAYHATRSLMHCIQRLRTGSTAYSINDRNRGGIEYQSRVE